MKSYWTRGPEPMTGVLIRGELGPNDQGEGFVMMGTEIPGMPLQAKNHQGALATRRTFRASQGTHSATLISDFRPPEPWHGTCLFLEGTHVVVICCRHWIHHSTQSVEGRVNRSKPEEKKQIKKQKSLSRKSRETQSKLFKSVITFTNAGGKIPYGSALVEHVDTEGHLAL